MRHATLLLSALIAASAAAPVRAQEVPDIAGIYEIQGETVVEGSPDRLAITGKLVVRQKGATCSTIVEAEMRRVAGTAGPVSAQLIGTGEMQLTGRKLAGKAELQSLVSEVPELDVAVAFAPRIAGPVLDATAQGEVLSDGSIKLEIRSTLTGEGFTLPEGRKTIVIAKRVARSPAELKKK
jgi:hypothetical protein